MLWQNFCKSDHSTSVNSCRNSETKQKTMNKKENEQEFVIREKGPVWNVKVGVYSYLADGFRIRNIQEKRWKVKEILN